LPSPLGAVTTGPIAPPNPLLSYGGSPAGGGFATATFVKYRMTFVTAGGETPADTGAEFIVQNGSGFSLSYEIDGIMTGPTGVTRRLYRTTQQASYAAAQAAQLKLVTTIADNVTTVYVDAGNDGALGANIPTINTATADQVSVSGIAIGAGATTARKLYRTAVNGSQLKLLTTLADNTTLTYADSTADGSLGANAPTGDTSGLTQPSGQVLAGATSLLVAGAGAGSGTGGWAVIGNGTQVVRYTGITGNSLTGIPVSGPGSITATVSYNSTVTFAPALIGIPASGAGAIVYPVLQGDPVNLLVRVDDLAAQTALAALIGGGDDGVVEDYISDGTIGETEARARGTAKLALSSTVLVSIAYKTRDKNTHTGRTIHVNLGSPTSLTGDFQIQQVTIDAFAPAIFPTYTVQASSSRFSLDDLLRLARKAA
jgi:hypothetical protein